MKRSHRILAPGLLRLVAILAVLAVSACGGTAFRTYYPQGLDPAVTRGWTVGNVKVDVPRQLSVSEERTYLPRADIVWREDPPGDRHAQVGKIIQTAVQSGAQGLRGPRPVIIEVTVTRFHALTFEAELSANDWGVHNIDFTARVLDAGSGAVLLPATAIRAELPALSGTRMSEARSRGVTQKSMIIGHVSKTVAGWLGLGPDNRGKFSRQGN